jgi:hypothetical protein
MLFEQNDFSQYTACQTTKKFMKKNLGSIFSNISSFNRVFKRIRGYAPGHIKRAITAKK